MKDFFKVHGLRDDEQVKGPRAAKVGHDNGVNGHRSEERLPRRRPEVGYRLLDAAERFLNVETLTGRDGRMHARLFEREPRPENVPNQPQRAYFVLKFCSYSHGF